MTSRALIAAATRRTARRFAVLNHNRYQHPTAAVVTNTSSTFNLVNHQQTSLATTRYYSTTLPTLKKSDDDNKDKDSNKDKYIYKLNTDMTDQEAEALVDAELERMQQEEADKFVVKPEDWKPGMRKRKLVVSRHLEDFERELFPDRFAPKWTLRDKRCGALAIKVGMMPIWDPVWGERYPCTVLYVDNNVVLGHKTQDQHGYNAVQVAAGHRKRKNVGKCLLGQYKNLLQYDPEEHPPYMVKEFRVTSPELLPPLYSRIHARHFVPGQNVDITGISKGKGFQGAMKRHNFGGMPATHGTSRSHRSLGSTGQCQDPGKVFKGKKMAGHMGSERVTVQNLRIVKMDRGRNLIFIQGAIPGQKGNFVELRDAVKRPLWNTELVQDQLDRPPLPTYDYSQDIIEEQEDIIDGSGQVGYEVFMPIGKEDPLDPDYRNTLTQLPVDD